MIRSCVYCEAPPVASIPQGRVCLPHAIEFYTGLVVFAIDRTREIAVPHLLPPCLAPPPRLRRSYVKRSASWKTMQPRAVAV